MKDRTFFICCFVVLLIIALCGWLRPDIETVPITQAWHMSSEEAPPTDRPFVAFYIFDGRPEPMTVYRKNNRYFAYAIGEQLLISDYPPSYWVEMPGIVE